MAAYRILGQHSVDDFAFTQDKFENQKLDILNIVAVLIEVNLEAMKNKKCFAF